MKTNSVKHKRINLVIFLAIILFVTVFALEKTRITNFISNPFYNATSSNTVDESNKKDSTLTNKNSVAKPTPGVDINKNTSEIDESQTIALLVGEVVQSEGLVVFSATITNPATTGICSAVFTSEGARPVSREVQPIEDSCSFSVPETDFTKLGNWTLTVRYFANDTQAVDTKEVNII